MKKALSVLLILAAIFGFYGGGVSLNDVLSCKDYWENEREKALSDLDKLEDGLDELGENTEAYMDGLDQVAQGEIDLAAGEKDYIAGQKDYKAAPLKLAAAKKQIEKGEKELAANAEAVAGARKLVAGIDQIKAGYNNDWAPGYNQLVGSKNQIVDGFGELTSNKILKLLPSGIAVSSAYKKAVNAGALNSLANFDQKVATNGNITKPLGQLANTLSGIADLVSKLDVEQLAKILPGLDISEITSMLPEAASKIKTLRDGLPAWDAGYDELNGGISTIAGGISQVADGLEPSTAKQVGLYQYKDTSILNSKSLEDFASTMKTINASLTTVRKGALEKINKYDAGVKTIEKGKKAYEQGLKDYKAAPAKLAAGKAKLDQGRIDLADGKSKLAEYEDGEQQIRDGLKTLMDTQAHGGILSIEERIGANATFSLADGNLDFKASYNGAKVGREYTDDLGVVVTKELTQRTIGYGLGIGAGVIALIAAFLGLKNKNKGAGVSGLIAAAAAGAGAYVAHSAGIELSEVAGSALGATPMLALGILAGVALVSAISCFAAPKVE